MDQKYTKGLTLYQHNVISRYVRDELKRKVDYLSLARGKQEIQEIVEREWTSAKSKNKTRKRLARYRGEGVQKREAIEPSPSQDKADGPRLIPPSVPHLLLPPLSEVPLEEAADDSAASNIESTRASKKELRLVSIQKKAEMRENGDTRTLKRIKQTTDKKASAAKSISSAKNKATNKQALPAEELDMTGWSGDYSLPK